MATIRTVLRTDRANDSGKCPVEIIYQLNGNRAYLRPNLTLSPINWDSTTNKAIYANERDLKKAGIKVDKYTLPQSSEIKAVNDKIQSTIQELHREELRLSLSGKPYTAADVVQSLKDKRTIKGKQNENLYLLDFIKQQIEDFAPVKKPQSLKTYRTMQNHLANYQQGIRKRIKVSDVDFNFMESFQTYLIELGLLNDTVIKQLGNLKTFLKHAENKGLEVNRSFTRLTMQKLSHDPIALNLSEFERLFYMDLKEYPKLERVRDLFCFSAATGLRYSDLAQLRREHIIEGSIVMTATKTKEKINVPLNKYSFTILETYKEQAHPLPIISNQKMNEYLKELCQLAGMDSPIEKIRYSGSKEIRTVKPKSEFITVHTGRRTFMTVCAQLGMHVETAMKLSGHKSYSVAKKYIDIQDKTRKDSMYNVWGQPEIIAR